MQRTNTLAYFVRMKEKIEREQDLQLRREELRLIRQQVRHTIVTIVTLSTHYRYTIVTLAFGVIDTNENKLECLSLFNVIVC
jgi:hypothetical protein